MAKNKKSKKGKVAGGVGIAAVIAALALFGGKGLGLGSGSGLGLGNDTKVNSDAQNQTDEVQDPVDEKKDETQEDKDTVTVSIEVKEGQYLIDGAEKTLADIEALLTAEDAENTSFTLVNNYAATKAWDEVKALFTKYGIAVTEE